jgi:hypothetical protein
MAVAKVIIQVVDLEFFFKLIRYSDEVISFNVLALGLGISISAHLLKQVKQKLHHDVSKISDPQ